MVSVVDPQPGETITDCCAAPGGKSLYMASRLQGQGKLVHLSNTKEEKGKKMNMFWMICFYYMQGWCMQLMLTKVA